MTYNKIKTCNEERIVDESVLLKDRICITGLEGCGKSSGLFDLLKDRVTEKEPVLFVYQTYRLMQEQIESWSERYSIPKNQFVICGHSDNGHKEIIEKFTNPEAPEVVPDNARFVFYSQSYLQRCRHQQLVFENNKRKFSRIILDEFDYTKSIIPTFDYQFSNVMNADLVKEQEVKFIKWMSLNYSQGDVNRIKYAKYQHNDGFVLAYWLHTSDIPVMFLTSEEISSKLLQAIGFDVYHHGVSQFTDCLVNIEPADYINDMFFNKMNIHNIWRKFEYDVIISNKIDSHYQTSIEVLERPVAVPHITAKGSNEYRGSDILTIISNIPDKAIKIIRDVFNFYNYDYTFQEVKGLYYKAQLLQSIGRVIGYRGSKQTDVVVHKSIWEAIKDNVTLPYNVNDKWSLEFEHKEKIIEYVKTVKTENRRKQANPKLNITSYGMLKKHFVESEGRCLSAKEVTQYLKQHKIMNKSGTGTLPVTKIADYFGKEIVVKKIKGKATRCLIGLDYAI
jgi:hypothetical protein